MTIWIWALLAVALTVTVLGLYRMLSRRKGSGRRDLEASVDAAPEDGGGRGEGERRERR